MKNHTYKPLRIAASVLSLLLLLLTSKVEAAVTNVYWDINGATTGSGSATPTGNWDTPNWSTSSTGVLATGAWFEGNFPEFSAGSDATGSYTITANSNHIIAGMLQRTSTGTVTITGTGVLSIAAGVQGFFSSGTLVISNTLGGTGGYEGQSGTVQLFGSNTYSGGTLLNGNLTYFNNSNSFGTGTITPLATGSPGFSALLSSGGSLVTIPNSFVISTANAGVNFASSASTPVTSTGNWNLQQTLFLRNNGNTTAPLILSGVVSNVGGLTVSANNAGTITLSGPNTYTGATSIAGNGSGAVTLSVSSLNSVSGGSASSSLGAPTTVANGTISIGTTTVGSVLVYTGPGETSDRVINLAGTTGGATLESDGSGPLVLTSSFTATGNGAKTLTLQGSSTGTNTIAGKIVNSTSATSVAKSGTGTWVLAGPNSYTGNTTLNTGGLLDLANASALGSGTLVIGGNGSFDNLTGSPLTIANGITLSGGSPTFVGSANLTINGAATISAANRTITVSASTLTLGAAIGDSAQTRSFTKAGGGTLVLSGVNTYTGNTTVSAGTLELGGSASLANTGIITINAGATYDVSAISAYTLSATNSLSAIGTALAATLNGGTTVSLGSRPLTLSFAPTVFTGDLTHPALEVAQGALTLNNNAVTVTNAGGTPLGAGTYLLVQVGDGTTGVITGAPNALASVKGAGLAAGFGGGITVSNGNVYLVVSTLPTFTSLASSQSISYGGGPITLGGTLSASGPVYPAQGDTITVMINGNSQTTTISDATGDFLINYDPSAIPASGSAYAINYIYGGNAALGLSPSSDSSTTLTVAKDPLTITANAQTKTYGQTVTFGTGSALFTSSGLTNGQTIGSVTLAVSGSGGAATAAVSGSPYTITPSAATGGTFSAANYTITYVTNTLTVNPATLTVTGNSYSRAFGATNPVFAVTYSNFVNSQTLGTSDVGGSPALTTSATTNSDVGAYDITNRLGTLTSTNYMFSLVDGTLTVTNAVSTNVVTASTNIAGPGTPVIFTAMLSTLAPSTAVPTNVVQFVVDSVAFGDPIPLTNGVASITNAALSHGSHTIEVDYAGDTNALGYTNILGSTNVITEVIDRAPFAGDSTYSRLRGALLEILLSDLHSNTFDPDGDLYTLVVSPTSTNGATIVVSNGVVIYTPPVTNADVADSFTYTVTDSFGLSGTGTVHVAIQQSSPVTITGLGILGDGTSQFSFTGLPNYTYLIQGTADLTPPVSWTTLGTNTAGTNGLIQFIDANATNFPDRYYRILSTQ